MKTKTETCEMDSALDKILRIEERIHAVKGDIEGLFENYVSDLILLREIRVKHAQEMVDDSVPSPFADRTPGKEGSANAD